MLCYGDDDAVLCNAKWPRTVLDDESLQPTFNVLEFEYDFACRLLLRAFTYMYMSLSFTNPGKMI